MNNKTTQPTKTIKLFETFAGLGAQHKALTNISKRMKQHNKETLNIEEIGISEWYIDAILSYDLIHNGNYSLFKEPIPSDEEILKYIETFTLSKDSKNPTSFDRIKKYKKEYLKNLYIALKRTKNYGSILSIKGEHLPQIDLFTYSFPCQDISNAGKGQGINKEKQLECQTRSGLLWEIERILLELKELNRLPKFLLMENVKALLQVKHYQDWLVYERFLESIGYKNTTVVLNGIDFGIPQKRERVFCISELNGTNPFIIKKQDRQKILNGKIGEFLGIDNKKYKEEYLSCVPNNTPSRLKIFEKEKKINYNSDFVFTITTKQDRSPNAGIVPYPTEDDKKSNFRYLTPRECIQLMGFESKDYEKIKDYISQNEIYKLAGNSIIVQQLEAIFEEIIERL
jgi:DNA (cytosine-5)-methyltransferase 1